MTTQPSGDDSGAPAATAPSPGSDLPRQVDLGLRTRLPDEGTLAVAPLPRPRAAPLFEAPESRSPEALAREAEGRRRVQTGLVDPYFLHLGKALLGHWNAEEHVSKKGWRGFTEQMKENNRLFGQIWSENARRYASAGSPVASDTPVPTVAERTGEASNAAARDAYRRQLKEQFTARKRALFRVVQNLDGTLRSVTLVEGSNEPAIDRQALADVRAAASRLPPPPPGGLGIREPIVSLWEFQLIVSISPPVPTVAFEFDEALKFLDVRMPLDRRIYKRVRLVSVE